MEKLQCVLCLEDVRVPVFFKPQCFPCPSPRGKPGCHSTRRVCLWCAREFLGLNKRFDQRKRTLKCLYCPTMGKPQKIRNADEAYQKDYSYMSLDTRKDYPCFHSTKGCTFQGSQNDLNRHVMSECLYRTTSCRCKAFFLAMDAEQHQQECLLYRKCPLCTTHVFCEEYHDHLLQEHQRKPCRHVGCDQLLPEDQWELHMARDCPFRSVRCTLCGDLQRVCDYQDHLSRHIVETQQKMVELVHQMKETQQLLQSSSNAYQKWMLTMAGVIQEE